MSTKSNVFPQEQVGADTLMEELLGDLLAPLLAELPGSAGVADVCTLQGHLQDKEDQREVRGTPQEHRRIIPHGNTRPNVIHCCAVRLTCRMKWRWWAWLRHRSSWSRWVRNRDRYSFCWLMSVARIREPSCLSMFRLKRGGKRERETERDSKTERERETE